MKIFCSVLFLFGIKLTFATFGFDISAACSEFSCLHNTYGAQFMITRAWQSYGAFDSSSIGNLQNARSAGIEYTDVYMFPCRSLSATTQMVDLISDLKATSIGEPLKKKEMNQAMRSVQKDFVLVTLWKKETIHQEKRK